MCVPIKVEFALPFFSIKIQSRDRMEEQLPSSERAGQGKKIKTPHVKMAHCLIHM